MAVKRSPAVVFGKWVVAPLVLALLGYFVIGPKIGEPSKSAKDVAGPSQADPPASTKPTGGRPRSTGPDVDVTVTPTPVESHRDTEVAQATPRHARRRHKKVVPAEGDTEQLSKPKAVEPPTTDEGGSAGSTTAG